MQYGNLLDQLADLERQVLVFQNDPLDYVEEYEESLKADGLDVEKYKNRHYSEYCVGLSRYCRDRPVIHNKDYQRLLDQIVDIRGRLNERKTT